MGKRGSTVGRQATQDKRLKLSLQMGAIQAHEAQEEEDQALEAIIQDLRQNRRKILPVWRLMSSGVLENSCVDFEAWFAAANPYLHKVPKSFLLEQLLPTVMNMTVAELQELEKSQRGTLHHLFYRACMVEAGWHIVFMYKAEFLEKMKGRAARVQFDKSKLQFESGVVWWALSGWYVMKKEKDEDAHYSYIVCNESLKVLEGVYGHQIFLFFCFLQREEEIKNTGRTMPIKERSRIRP